VLDDEQISEPLSVWLNVVGDPLLGSRGEGTEQKKCVLIIEAFVRWVPRAARFSFYTAKVEEANA